MRTTSHTIATLMFTVIAAIGLCTLKAAPGHAAETRDLILAAYSVPKEAYERHIIPAFQRYWKQKTGQDVRVRSSYGASGAQARAIIGGFDADVGWFTATSSALDPHASIRIDDDFDRVSGVQHGRQRRAQRRCKHGKAAGWIRCRGRAHSAALAGWGSAGLDAPSPAK